MSSEWHLGDSAYYLDGTLFTPMGRIDKIIVSLKSMHHLIGCLSDTAHQMYFPYWTKVVWYPARECTSVVIVNIFFQIHHEVECHSEFLVIFSDWRIGLKKSILSSGRIHRVEITMTLNLHFICIFSEIWPNSDFLINLLSEHFLNSV